MPLPKIYWSVKARRRLRSVLAWSLRRLNDDTFQQRLKGLDDILQRTFPDATAVMVQNQLLGYRQQQRATLFILLVEVFGSPAPGAYVVKIGPPKKLTKELKGWLCCRPDSLRHDLVFLSLEEGYRATVRTQPQLMSLVYGDGQQFIGVDDTMTLEEAALQSILHGLPTLNSIGLVIWELYERVGYLLYTQSFVHDPRDGRPYKLDIPHLSDSMLIWDADQLKIRVEVNTAVRHGPGLFIDPVDYLQYVTRFVHRKTKAKAIQALANGGVDSSLPPIPRTEDVVPRMLRGCAHGDLHGRNILVGQVRGNVLWPTIFDYEDMGPYNLLGWDFVKLETELKIRACPKIFARSPVQFIEQLQRFEIDLCEETERCHLDQEWNPVVDSGSPEARLRAIMLEIRHRAAVHLGINCGRPNDWLEEYYFLLACYGVCTSRFSNLQRKEQTAAFVSSGVAAARLSWPRRVLGAEPC